MQDKHKKDPIEDLTVIIANQNYYTRTVIDKVIDFIATIFVAFVISLLVNLVAGIIIAIASSNKSGNPLPVMLVTIIVAFLINCVLIVAVVQCFKKHASEIEDLHRECTDLETAKLQDTSSKQQD